MSTVFVVPCPTCGMGLNAPEEFLGREVRCPGCRAVFTPPARSTPDTGGAAGNGEQQTITDSRPGAGLPPAPRPEGPLPEEGAPAEDDRPWEQRDRWGGGVRRDAEPHRATLVLVLGIVSVVMFSFCGLIGLALGIMAWVMGARDLKKMAAGEMDPAGEGNTRAGMICGIVGTILNVIWTLIMVLWVVFEVLLVSMIVSSAPRPAPVAPPMPGPPPIVVPNDPPKGPEKGGPEGP
jgi:hypothetical protein